MAVLANLVVALQKGALRVIDLTQPLSEKTPILQLPPPFANTPGWKNHLISKYDDKGPAWYWNWFEGGEHVGTHFDAPNHWITGRGEASVDRVPVRHLIAPAVLIDKSSEAAGNPDYLLTVDDIKQFEARHGPLPKDCWLLYRTGWDARADDQGRFLNANETGPHTPGPTAEAIQFLISKDIKGWGSETIGTDAGKAGGMEPPFPAHTLMHKANRYGLASLCNLDQLPPKGAILIAAPLKIEHGTGSPIRALALVPGK
jgi:kynurenine formamidase